MLRTDIIREKNLFYNEGFIQAEDYLFLVKLSEHTKLANLDIILLDYRQHEGQISYYKQELQNEKTNK